MHTHDVCLCSLFERALAFVETEYLGHPLWDKYFQFEMDQGQMQNVAQLYGRVLSVACKELKGYHGKYVILLHFTPSPFVHVRSLDDRGSIPCRNTK